MTTSRTNDASHHRRFSIVTLLFLQQHSTFNLPLALEILYRNSTTLTVTSPTSSTSTDTIITDNTWLKSLCDYHSLHLPTLYRHLILDQLLATQVDCPNTPIHSTSHLGYHHSSHCKQILDGIYQQYERALHTQAHARWLSPKGLV